MEDPWRPVPMLFDDVIAVRLVQEEVGRVATLRGPAEVELSLFKTGGDDPNFGTFELRWPRGIAGSIFTAALELSVDELTRVETWTELCNREECVGVDKYGHRTYGVGFVMLRGALADTRYGADRPSGTRIHRRITDAVGLRGVIVSRPPQWESLIEAWAYWTTARADVNPFDVPPQLRLNPDGD